MASVDFKQQSGIVEALSDDRSSAEIFTEWTMTEGWTCIEAKLHNNNSQDIKIIEYIALEEMTDNDPDVAFEFYGNSQYYGKSTQFTDLLIPSGLPISWTTDYLVTDLSKTCSFDIYDIDALSNDLMGSVSFTPKNYATSTPPNNYPSTIQLTSGQITIIINVSWE